MHKGTYNQTLEPARRVAYSTQEMLLVAEEEVKLLQSGRGVSKINQVLIGSLPEGTIRLERLRAMRKTQKYRNIVRSGLQETEDPGSSPRSTNGAGGGTRALIQDQLPEGVNDPDPSDPDDSGSDPERDIAPELGARVKLWEHLRALSEEEEEGDALVVSLNSVLRAIPSPDGLTEHHVEMALNGLEAALRAHKPRLFSGRTPRQGVNRVSPSYRHLPRRVRKRMEYAQTQRAYKRSPKEIANKIINDVEFGGERPSVDEFVAEFRPRFAAESPPDYEHVEVRTNDRMLTILDPIAGKEVVGALRGPETAVGPENPELDTGALRRLGPRVLLRIFNTWLYLARVPQWTKNSRMSMLPKKSPLGTPSNWRPITIGSHILRAYCKILAFRMVESANTSIIQKAFRSVDGCGENLAFVEGLIRHARREKRNIYITFVDVAKAFDTVSHTSLDRALRRLDTPNHLLDVVKDLYSHVGTSICVPGGESDPIPMTRGVKQGCPLSPFLFCAVVDEYLESLGPVVGYRLDDVTSVAVTGFADDLVIVSESRLGMQRSLNQLDRFLGARGLAAQPTKCATLGLERAARAAIGLPMRDGGVASDDPAVRFIASGGLWGREVGAMARHFRVGHVDNNTLSQLKRSLLRKKREEWSTSWHGKGAENFFGSRASNTILRNDLGPGRKAIDLLRLRSQTINCRVSRAIGRKNGQYSVLDVCVPFESDINTLRLAEQHKIDKYRAHEVDIRRFIANNSSLPPVAAVNFLGVAFGARGGIRPATIKLLSRLGIRRAGIEILVTMAIEGSINILRSLRLQADG
ncbi:uncharacterized protein LOC121865689 [Homarus americanus]|uniref:uncharacterized protein LOC121865689 n=1 Tax=Homarus americanus TaxID=6706 RepID=UPI001C456BFE|nr:uncharacterized protein LOC121865689 [Homarus americanus]